MLRSLTLRRSHYFLAAMLLAFTSILPLVLTQKASAYNVLNNREIKISSSAPSATGVSYYVEFDAGTTATVKSIVVDFCANSPIIDDSCTGTVGTSVPDLGASPTVDTTTANVGNIGASWTAASMNSNRTLTLTKAAGVAMTSGTPYYFTVSGVTNPSATGTFYARILTFPNDTTSNYANGYTATNVDTNLPTDAGGIALSTAAQITVTAKVQERLIFCIYTDSADPDYNDNDCISQQGTAVTLGDTNGVLDPTGPYVDKNARFSITTNASSSAIVRFKGATLTSGGNTITAVGGTPATSTAGSEQFGLCLYQQAGSGMTIDGTYDGGSGSECSTTAQTAGTGSTGGTGTPTQAEFAYDTNGTTGTTSTYGATLATKPAGNYSTGNIAFVGNISNTTEAGIYTSTLTFIATGTY